MTFLIWLCCTSRLQWFFSPVFPAVWRWRRFFSAWFFSLEVWTGHQEWPTDTSLVLCRSGWFRAHRSLWIHADAGQLGGSWMIILLVFFWSRRSEPMTWCCSMICWRQHFRQSHTHTHTLLYQTWHFTWPYIGLSCTAVKCIAIHDRSYWHMTWQWPWRDSDITWPDMTHIQYYFHNKNIWRFCLWQKVWTPMERSEMSTMKWFLGSSCIGLIGCSGGPWKWWPGWMIQADATQSELMVWQIKELIVECFQKFQWKTWQTNSV